MDIAHRKNLTNGSIPMVRHVVADSGCMIAAATVDVIMYQYSTFLSIPSVILSGAFTVPLISPFRSTKAKLAC
jgi:hypothetical protein